jgi:glycosyltransferase involved in cell wall biosynthesis
MVYPSTMPDGRPWPRISVTVPSFNQGSFLEATLRSLILQGYPDLEIHVMDGGSTDSSVEVLAAYSPWLTTWVSEKDRGQSHAINKGWARSTGKILAYLNSDDYYLPGALYCVALAWNYNPRVAMVTGGIRRIDEMGRVQGEQAPFLAKTSPLDLSLLEIGEWYLPQQSSFFVASYLEAVGRWVREDLHFTMDRELMYRLCRFGSVVLVQEILAVDRYHGVSKRAAKVLDMYREDAKALAYCTWGDARSRKRRQKIARARMGQGHWLYGRRNSSTLLAFWHRLVAIYYRPDYLFSTTLGESFLNLYRRIKAGFLGGRDPGRDVARHH